jgi:hypothetical protein
VSLVRFNTSGEVVFIYEDQHPCLGVGRPSIKRASHVEPDADGLWAPNMKPVGGPKLEPWVQREEALRSEKVWIETNLLDGASLDVV